VGARDPTELSHDNPPYEGHPAVGKLPLKEFAEHRRGNTEEYADIGSEADPTLDAP